MRVQLFIIQIITRLISKILEIFYSEYYFQA